MGALRPALGGAAANVQAAVGDLQSEIGRLRRENAALRARASLVPEVMATSSAEKSDDATSSDPGQEAAGLSQEMSAATQSGLPLHQLLAVVRIQAHMRGFLRRRTMRSQADVISAFATLRDICEWMTAEANGGMEPVPPNFCADPGPGIPNADSVGVEAQLSAAELMREIDEACDRYSNRRGIGTLFSAGALELRLA